MTKLYKYLKERVNGSSKLQTSLSLLVMMLFSTSLLTAQTISGVVSSADGEPLIGATILEKGTANGTVTDFDGSFSIDVSTTPAILEVSYIGFATKEVSVQGAESDLQVTLTEGELLDEVVVTALGIQRKTKNLTYAVQKIDGSDLTEVRDPNFANTLNGKVAGVVVTQGAGGPGSAARVVLRGNTSISGNNNALFVVDGVPLDNTSFSQVATDFGGYNTSDGASNINPHDIESVTVLKGAAAAALYGSRAQNGVIQISTKKGQVGKVKVNLNAGITTESPFILPQTQNTFGQGNGGVSNTTSNGSWGAATNTFPDNISDFFRPGMSSNLNVGISGGSEQTQAYFSFTNDRAQGIVERNSLNRNTFNLRLNHQISDKLSADVKTTYVQQDIDNRIKVGEENGTVINIYKIPRSTSLASLRPLINSDGSLNYWTTSSINQNPYWITDRTSNDEIRERVIFQGSLKYQFRDNLSLLARANMDRSNDRQTFEFSDQTLILAGNGGSYSEGYGNVTEQNFDLLLSGFNDLSSKWRVDYNFGAALNQIRASYTQVDAVGLQFANNFNLTNGRNLNTVINPNERDIQSVYGTVSLAYNDYLIFDATARNDWSSTLPAPHSFFYPSFGLTGVISDMVELPDAFTFLKARGSWTRVGNDAPPYALQQGFTPSQGGSGGLLQRASTQALANLQPEETTSIEFGIDARFFRNRLGIDATWYKSNTVNQIITIARQAPSGFANQRINAGDIQNSGIELSINYKAIDTKDFTYTSTINFARNVNEVIELSEETKRAELGAGFSRTGNPVVEEGSAYGALYGEGWKRDAQGRFVVNAQGLPIGTGRNGRLLGNFNPDFTLGWINNFNYKGVSLKFLIDGRFGGVMVSGSDANLAFDGNADYTTAFREGGWVLDAVTEEGATNTQAISAEQFWTTVSQGRYSWGEFFTYDATNVRLREVSAGYDINLPENSPFSNMRISLVARNLFFFYRGKAKLDVPGLPERKMNFDPEINLGAGNFQGVEYGTLPATRSFGINLNVGF